MFTDFWKVFALSYLEIRNTVLLELKRWWKNNIYWLLKSSCFGLCGDWKYGLFLAKKLMERWYLLIMKSSCFKLFGDGKYGLFFKSESWWKDDIYWLLKSSCFPLFRDGKYGLLWAKKLMERWYLLGVFQFSMTFQDLGNMVFCAMDEVYKGMDSCVALHKK